MGGLIIISTIVAVPALLLFLLRSNAAIVFLALCTGSVMAKYVVTSNTALFKPIVSSSPTALNYLQIGLILLPAVITALLLREHIRGSKVLINLLPSIACGLTVAFLVVPLLPYGLKSQVTPEKSWILLQQYQAVVFAGGAAVSFLLLWSGRQGKKHGKHH